MWQHNSNVILNVAFVTNREHAATFETLYEIKVNYFIIKLHHTSTALSLKAKNLVKEQREKHSQYDKIINNM